MLKPSELNEPSAERSGRLFLRMATVGTALALGVMFAAVQALRITSDRRLTFQVSIWTWVTFAAAAAVGWFYWRLVLRGGKRRGILLSAALLVAAFAAFLYPLRFAASEKVSDIIQGLLLAIAGLAIVGRVIWIVIQFLERDDKNNPPPDRMG